MCNVGSFSVRLEVTSCSSCRFLHLYGGRRERAAALHYGRKSRRISFRQRFITSLLSLLIILSVFFSCRSLACVNGCSCRATQRYVTSALKALWAWASSDQTCQLTHARLRREISNIISLQCHQSSFTPILSVLENIWGPVSIETSQDLFWKVVL